MESLRTVGVVYCVVAQALTDQQLQYVAQQLLREAQDIYRDDPGVYPTFDMFLGFRIGVESVRYVQKGGGRKEMERFAGAVIRLYEHDLKKNMA